MLENREFYKSQVADWDIMAFEMQSQLCRLAAVMLGRI